MYSGEKWGKFCSFRAKGDCSLSLVRAVDCMFLLVVFAGIYLSLVSD